MKNNLKLLILLSVLILPVAACGIKPNSVDAPAGSEEPDNFPRTYPSY